MPSKSNIISLLLLEEAEKFIKNIADNDYDIFANADHPKDLNGRPIGFCGIVVAIEDIIRNINIALGSDDEELKKRVECILFSKEVYKEHYMHIDKLHYRVASSKEESPILSNLMLSENERNFSVGVYIQLSEGLLASALIESLLILVSKKYYNDIAENKIFEDKSNNAKSFAESLVIEKKYIYTGLDRKKNIIGPIYLK